MPDLFFNTVWQWAGRIGRRFVLGAIVYDFAVYEICQRFYFYLNGKLMFLAAFAGFVCGIMIVMKVVRLMDEPAEEVTRATLASKYRVFVEDIKRMADIKKPLQDLNHGAVAGQATR